MERILMLSNRTECGDSGIMSYQEWLKENKTKKKPNMFSLLNWLKDSSFLSLQDKSSIVMDGVKAYVVFGGFLAALSGKDTNMHDIDVYLIYIFISTCTVMFPIPSFSYLWTVATNHRVQWRRVHPAAQLRLQHQLHREKKRGLGRTPAEEHLRVPRVLHGHTLHLQRDSGEYRVLHVCVWKPREWAGWRPGRGQWGGNIRVCPRWIWVFTQYWSLKTQ